MVGKNGTQSTFNGRLILDDVLRRLEEKELDAIFAATFSLLTKKRAPAQLVCVSSSHVTKIQPQTEI